VPDADGNSDTVDPGGASLAASSAVVHGFRLDHCPTCKCTAVADSSPPPTPLIRGNLAEAPAGIGVLFEVAVVEPGREPGSEAGSGPGSKPGSARGGRVPMLVTAASEDHLCALVNLLKSLNATAPSQPVLVWVSATFIRMRDNLCPFGCRSLCSSGKIVGGVGDFMRVLE
jgi:hypothetical protein